MFLALEVFFLFSIIFWTNIALYLKVQERINYRYIIIIATKIKS